MLLRRDFNLSVGGLFLSNLLPFKSKKKNIYNDVFKSVHYNKCESDEWVVYKIPEHREIIAVPYVKYDNYAHLIDNCLTLIVAGVHDKNLCSKYEKFIDKNKYDFVITNDNSDFSSIFGKNRKFRLYVNSKTFPAYKSERNGMHALCITYPKFKIDYDWTIEL
jgi:hypothetical protein